MEASCNPDVHGYASASIVNCSCHSPVTEAAGVPREASKTLRTAVEVFGFVLQIFIRSRNFARQTAT